MNCLQCGKKTGVTFLRKARDSKFCSEEHRLQFFAQQEQIALARLIDTQVPRAAPRPPLGPKPQPEPPVCSFLPPRLSPSSWLVTTQFSAGQCLAGETLVRPFLTSRIANGVLSLAQPRALPGPGPANFAFAALAGFASPHLSRPQPSPPVSAAVTRFQGDLSRSAARPLTVLAPVGWHGPAARPLPDPLGHPPWLARPPLGLVPRLPGALRSPAAVPVIQSISPCAVISPVRPIPPRPAKPIPIAPVAGRSGLCPRRPRVRFDEDPPLAGPRGVTTVPAALPACRKPVRATPLPSQAAPVRTSVSKRHPVALHQPSAAGARLPSLDICSPPQAYWRQPIPVARTPRCVKARPRIHASLPVALGSAKLASLWALPAAGSVTARQPLGSPLATPPLIRQPHPTPVQPRRAPGMAVAVPVPVALQSAASPPRWFCQAPVSRSVECARPVMAGAKARLWMPAPGGPVQLTSPAAHPPPAGERQVIRAGAVALAGPRRLPAAPLALRHHDWLPVRPGRLFGLAMPAAPASPPQPRDLLSTAVRSQPHACLSYPKAPRVRAASAPVARPAAKLLPLPGAGFAPRPMAATPSRQLTPLGLPLETRRIVQGLQLRHEQDLDGCEGLTPWQRLSHRVNAHWRTLPSAPKWGAVATALLLAGFASVPGIETARASLSSGWLDPPPFVANRAAIQLGDDFRRGLAHWKGHGDWSRAWTFDPAGFLQTGPLALFRPSSSLTNYEFEFLGQIQRKGMGWVVRARDLNNYQSLKLAIVGGGGVPEVRLIRFPVVGGRQGKVTERRVPLDLRQDTVYNVSTRVNGSDFTVTIQGQLADYWSEPALPAGGVGLFSSKGEQARIRWIEVRHQNDTLGKLCALLAPPAQTGANQ